MWLIGLLCSSAIAQGAGLSYSRETVERLAPPTFSQDMKDKLRLQGFVVVPSATSSMFAPYLQERYPQVVTADVMLYVFASVLRRAVRDYDRWQAGVLDQVLAGAIDRLVQRKDEAESGPNLVELLLTARALLRNSRPLLLPPMQGPDVSAFAECVARARGNAIRIRSAWGKSACVMGRRVDIARDARVAKDGKSRERVGLALARELLGAYSFSLDDAVERRVAESLCWAVFGERQLGERYREIIDTSEALFGKGGLGSLVDLRRVLQGRERVPAQGAKAGRVGPDASGTDARASIPATGGQGLFCILPLAQPPANRVFRRTVAPKVQGRALPQSIELLASGPFASECGRTAAFDVLRDERVKVALRGGLMDAERAADSGLFAEAIRALGKLATVDDGYAESPFRTQAWMLKQCETQLAGWALLRSVTASQHAVFRNYLVRRDGRLRVRATPHVAFIEELGNVSGGIADVLEGVVDVSVSTAREASRRLKEVRPTVERWLGGGAIRVEENVGIERWMRFVSQLTDFEYAACREPDEDFQRAALAVLAAALSALESGRALSASQADHVRMFVNPGIDGVALLRSFTRLCAMLLKVTINRPVLGDIGRAEREVLDKIAVMFARHCGYFGNSYMHLAADERGVLDDQVAVAETWRDGSVRQRLYVGCEGVGELYVISELNGRHALFVGATVAFGERVAVTGGNEARGGGGMESELERLPFTGKYWSGVIARKR